MSNKEPSIELQHALLQAYLRGADVYGAIPTGEVRWEWEEQTIESEQWGYPVYRATVFAREDDATAKVTGRQVTSGIGIHVQTETVKFYSSAWSWKVPRQDIPEFRDLEI